MSGISKEDVLKELATLRFPFGLGTTGAMLRDVMPDIDCVAFCPAFKWTNQEKRDRDDRLVILYEAALAICRAETEGSEPVDFGGAIQLRQKSRSVELRMVPLSLVVEARLEWKEGERERYTEPLVEPILTIRFADESGLPTIRLPADEDLEGLDRNDREEWFGRVRSFADALIGRLAHLAPGTD